MQDIKAAIAANRFGLGAKPQDSAEIGMTQELCLAIPENDPREWLKIKLEAFVYLSLLLQGSLLI